MTADGSSISFWGDKNILKLTVVMAENKQKKREEKNTTHKVPETEDSFFKFQNPHRFLSYSYIFSVHGLKDIK